MSTCCKIALDDIKWATSDFSWALVVGEGGFGKVYRGKIDEKLVAVKRMRRPPLHGDRTFENEINMLTKCNHDNIISLVGYCDEQNERALVYEFMPNGSLYHQLYERKEGTTPLTVEQRLEICLGVAKALNYLHFDHYFSILHFDLNSENILLDGNLVPKLADFGLSRYRVAGPSLSTKAAKPGTLGYIAPECYEPDYIPSRKTDVYALGVVLLEVLSEKRARETLVQSGLQYIMGGELERYTPGYVEAYISPPCMRACENIIKDCLEHDPHKRPFMDELVDRLQSALELQPTT